MTVPYTGVVRKGVSLACCAKWSRFSNSHRRRLMSLFSTLPRSALPLLSFSLSRPLSEMVPGNWVSLKVVIMIPLGGGSCSPNACYWVTELSQESFVDPDTNLVISTFNAST